MQFNILTFKNYNEYFLYTGIYPFVDWQFSLQIPKRFSHPRAEKQHAKPRRWLAVNWVEPYRKNILSVPAFLVSLTGTINWTATLSRYHPHLADEKTNAQRGKVNVTQQPIKWSLESNWDLSNFKVRAPSTLKRFASHRINEYFRVPSNVKDLSFQLFLIIAPNEYMNN